MSKPDFTKSVLARKIFKDPGAKSFTDHCMPGGQILLSELIAFAAELGVDDLTVNGEHDVTLEPLLEIWWNE